MFRSIRVSAALAIAVAVVACGGSSGTPPASPPPGPTSGASVCAAALEADTAPELSVAPRPPRLTVDKRTIVDGDPRGRALESIWIHRAALARRAAGQPPSAAVTTPAPVAQDQGEIAIVQDQGDIVLPPNLLDLKGVGLRFAPSGPDGYSVTTTDATFRSALGSRLTLGDDDSADVTVPFAFPFYGRSQTAAFVNSDGNITFGEEDKASTDRNVARLLSGAPRVAPFLSDLDPSSGGKVFVDAAAGQYTVTWCGVPAFGSQQTVTTQVTLLPDGSVEMKYDPNVTIGDAVVGVSPGRTGVFTPVDLSKAPVAGTGAVGERFAASGQLDAVALMQKFYASHPDNYDQVLLWADQRVIPASDGAFSYEQTVANEIRGIGQDTYDLSHDYGSAGRLRSVVVMDALSKFPNDPTQKFLGENDTLSVMGQEVGHRWLAYLEFRDHTGATSDALLGRDLAHWSFFFDSDASVMEGNQIQDLGGGKFQTVAAVQRYGDLDQYAMGLIPPSQVAPFFYVESPVTNPTRVAADPPMVGVTFTGTRRDVLIDDVIAVEGARSPTSDRSPHVHRQAFVYLVGSGRSADAGQVAKLDTIRRQWEGFFAEATGGRMTAMTTLR